METSANTEYKLCIIDCDNSGTTITTPHATYTDGQGNEIKQMNTTQLGGNGLYS
jgi:hypothetical protein